MSTLIDGRKTREALLPGLIKKIEKLSKAPTLAIVQIGDRPDSTAFIRAKKSFAKKIGVFEKHIQLKENASLEEVLTVIKECNDDPVVTGIIVQLPLPAHLDRDAVIDAIDPKKDADGLTASNVKSWLEGRSDAVWPATARGIREMLHHYNISMKGKKVTVVGRSMLVGKPIAAMCLNENATVTICHRETVDLAKETSEADIIIVATGKPGLIGREHVRSGQIVIDVGISRKADNTLSGDVDYDSVHESVEAISPVPGGVGPMTVFALFENLIDLGNR
ncbi:MAG: bifunctional 5,10-methylenetetrahydrofolate dehydrogenase/5,10-methenyltetrahydrofolate cyclohydrolase [Candidatus Paceibacterota bacterium]